MSKEFTEDDMRNFAVYYRNTQGKCDVNTWGKDLLEMWKASHQPKEDKLDWEIVAYKSDWSGKLYSSKDLEFIKHDYKIHSVKRLSDGETFSVGDFVSTYAGAGGNGFSDKIHHFTFTSEVDIIDVYFENHNGAFDIKVWLNNAQKSKPKEERPQYDKNVSSIKLSKNDSPKEEVKGKYHYVDYSKNQMGEDRFSDTPISATITLNKPEEVKEPDRIWVDIIRPASNYDDIFVRTNKTIPRDKWPEIQQAIEQVLNDDGKHGIKQFEEKFYWLGTELIPIDKVDKMMEDAFNAAREGKTFTVYESKLLSENVIYKDFQDYKSKLSIP